MSRDIKYIGMDVHKEAVVIAVLNSGRKLVTAPLLSWRSVRRRLHGTRAAGRFAFSRSIAARSTRCPQTGRIHLGDPTPQNEDSIEVRHNECSQERPRRRLQRPIEIAARRGGPPEQDHAAHHLEQHQGHQHRLDHLGPIPFPQRLHHRLVELVAESHARSRCHARKMSTINSAEVPCATLSGMELGAVDAN